MYPPCNLPLHPDRPASCHVPEGLRKVSRQKVAESTGDICSILGDSPSLIPCGPDGAPPGWTSDPGGPVRILHGH